MATIYVNSAAGGANNGTSKTDAYTSLASATGAAAGDTILIHEAHSQVGTVNTTYNFTGGTADNPVKLICIDFADDSLSSGAVVGVDTNKDLYIYGHVYLYGVNLRYGGRGFLGNSNARQFYESCGIATISGSSGVGDLRFDFGAAMNLTFLNCAIDLKTNGSGAIEVNAYAKVAFFGGTVTTGSSESFVIRAANRPASVLFQDVDLSACGNASLCAGSSTYNSTIRFSRCRLPTSWAADNGSFASNGFGNEVIIEGSDSGTITLPIVGPRTIAQLSGTISPTLAVYRTGGANDRLNANAFSLAMVSNASATEIYKPLIAPEIQRFVVPDASISGATARGVFTSTRCAPLATPTALTTDSGSTWNGSGVGTKQKIDHTLTNGQTLTVYVASGGTLNNDDFWIEVSEPDQVGGPVSVVCCLAKPSTTVYVDPKLEIAA